MTEHTQNRISENTAAVRQASSSEHTASVRHAPSSENTAQKKEPEKTDYKEFSDSCFSKSVCSANDCTGLIPSLPSSEAELDAYEEMYQFCLAGASVNNMTAPPAR